MEQKGSIEPKKGGVPSRQGLYSVAAAHSVEAIGVLVKLLKSKNEGIRLGAAKALLAKSIPDLRSTELTSEVGEPIKVVIRQMGYIPSVRDSERPIEIKTL